MPEATPLAALSTKPAGVEHLRRVVRKSSPEQYSRTRPKVGGSTNTPTQETM